MNKYRELRMKTGLSMQKFGDKYGIPMRTVQGWELERFSPPEYMFTLLERVVNEDFGEPPRPTPPELDDQDLAKLMELCDELIGFIRLYR